MHVRSGWIVLNGPTEQGFGLGHPAQFHVEHAKVVAGRWIPGACIDGSPQFSFGLGIPLFLGIRCAEFVASPRKRGIQAECLAEQFDPVGLTAKCSECECHSVVQACAFRIPSKGLLVFGKRCCRIPVPKVGGTPLRRSSGQGLDLGEALALLEFGQFLLQGGVVAQFAQDSDQLKVDFRRVRTQFPRLCQLLASRFVCV